MDILFCIADHYEPDHGNVDRSTRQARVKRWVDEYPRLAARFVDADGCAPQHTFFSPLEVYEEELLDGLGEICAAGCGEVEVHLHHDDDTSDLLRTRLQWFTDVLVRRHGLLGLDGSGRPAYGFVHGNWALDNGRPDGRFCGVNDELTILAETGCYADFTMPAAPDPAQSRTVNALYYAVDDPQRPRSYDYGEYVRAGGIQPPGSVAIVQGPLVLDWAHRSRGILPRIDNAAIDSSPFHRPTLERFRAWVDAAVSVSGRPEWVFVKVHTHGAKEANAAVLLGDAMRQFHEDIGRHFNDGARFRLHYVTAREMYNIMKAAEGGHSGNPGAYRDFKVAPPRAGARGGPVSRPLAGVTQS